MPNDANPTEQSYNVLTVPTDAIRVDPDHNPRATFATTDLARLEHAIATRGFNQPLLVKSDPDADDAYILIDGERRLRAARQAGLDTIPVLVKADQGHDDPGALVDALLASDLGVKLDVIEEAHGYQRLLDDGFTRQGIAQAFKIPQQRVRHRLAILTLPEPVQQQVADGVIPLAAIKVLNLLAGIHADLPVVAARRVLNVAADRWQPAPTWEQISADPIAVLARDYDDLPSDVYVGGRSYAVGRFTLTDEATANLVDLAINHLNNMDPDDFQVRLGREAIEQAAALKATHCSRNGYATLVVGQEVADQLAADYIGECLRVQRSMNEAAASEQPDTPTAQSSDPHRDGDAERERRREADARNEILGATVLHALARMRANDVRVIKILTAAPLSTDLAKIAARGAALCLPGWAHRDTYKNGNPKITYMTPKQAEAKARLFLAGATDAADVVGRCLVLVALARHADEQAVPGSQRTGYSLRFDSYCSDMGVPWRDDAADLLDEILIQHLPADVSRPIADALDERKARAAEQEQLARERDALVADLMTNAPNMSTDDRHTTIEEIRRT